MGQSVTLAAEPLDSDRGTYGAGYVPRISGGYHAQATVHDAGGRLVGRSEAGWAQDLDALEYQSLVPNRGLLAQLAEQTGGQVLELSDLESFARRLPRQKGPVTEVWVHPLWDLPGFLPAILVFVLACFGMEWALRRWKGMP
jgi:hypothetical protein